MQIHPTRQVAAWLVLGLLVTACGSAPATASQAITDSLSESERKRLADGKLVLRSARAADDEPARGFVGLLEIEASNEQVWQALLDFEALVDAEPALREVERYGDTTVGDERRIDVAYRLVVFRTEVRYHLRHRHDPAAQLLEWTLDPARVNDLGALDGSFQVLPGSLEGRQLLVYRSSMELTQRIPDWVEDSLTKTTLRDFLRSIKRRAEG